VPTDRSRDLLDWSHRHVKMYELDTTEAQAASATAAAGEFREYVLELVDERRRAPRDDLVTALADAEVDDGRLSDDEIVSTVVVL
jgi:unspecific monooxygenase